MCNCAYLAEPRAHVGGLVQVLEERLTRREGVGRERGGGKKGKNERDG